MSCGAPPLSTYSRFRDPDGGDGGMRTAATVLIVLVVAAVIVCGCYAMRKGGRASGCGARMGYRGGAAAGGHAVQEFASVSEMENILKGNRRSVVMVHADWCGHCQECIGKFRAAGPSASCPLYTANFDALIKPSGYDKKWDINSFPTFIMFSGQNPIRRKEDGGRETDDFVQFAAS